MRAFIAIFRLEFLGLLRTRALPLLMVASLAWTLIIPRFLRTDGTIEGRHELTLRLALGGAAALVAIAMTVAGCGTFSRERAARRLQLTLIRPVRLWVIATAKIAALSAVGALSLAPAVVVEALRQDGSRTCFSVFRPVLPSPAEEAAAMYEAYRADPETPANVKKAKKSVVLRLLTQRAMDHYQTVNTNDAVSWKFNLTPAECACRPALSMRLRFTNLYEMRDEVSGRLSAAGYGATVSNITQAIVKIPLVRTNEGNPTENLDVTFANDGSRPVMLRPRKDVELLAAADGFRANLLRCYLQLVGLLTLLIAFGVFLGSVLSRPVAVFTAVVTLALAEMSPSVIEQYPDELETNRLDAIGLHLARFTAAATHPVGSIHPLTSLAADERIEPRELTRTFLTDALALPMLLVLLTVGLVARKQDDGELTP